MAVTYDLIASSTPSGTATATFSSLGSYTDLIIHCYMAATTNADFYLRFNGDTSGSYYALQGASTAANIFDNSTINAGGAIVIVGMGNTPQGAPDFTTVEVTIPEYRNAIVKNANIRFGYISNPTNGAANVGFALGNWRNTAAITSLAISVTGGNFATGTTINLYGVTAGNA